jgi:hypothetical protein
MIVDIIPNSIVVLGDGDIGDAKIKVWVKLLLLVGCNHVVKGEVVIIATKVNVGIGINIFVPAPIEKEISLFLWFCKGLFRKK